MNRDLHLNALTTFERRKEHGHPGWQPTLPSEPGVVHAVRRYGAIATIEQPEYLESPPEYQRAVCGAKVEVILPTAFGLNQAEGCRRCTSIVRHERQHGLAEPTPWDGNPWWKRLKPTSSSVAMRRPDRLSLSHSA
ncbi:hypothetical protein PTW37_06585 [Arthrobacter agilis]|uniref:hypothetical protein n=1 Tax=Arthrobacter agilis TaxID=37921 RepID=UPI002366853C|nr:hypothetical protein [Arthrobacter agilis]WDF34561.1 hypothetical protein PTW37_06585 [Arthrobacter agilis]